MRHIPRPLAVECPAYFGRYTNQIPENEILRVLVEQGADLVALLAPLGDDGALHRYAPGKWSLKEMIGHITDMERLFVFRCLSFARGAPDELPGADEDLWVENADFDAVPLADLLAEAAAVRAATVRFFNNLDDTGLARRGRANGMDYRVSCMPWLIAGHERHHMNVIRERYL